MISIEDAALTGLIGAIANKAVAVTFVILVPMFHAAFKKNAMPRSLHLVLKKT
jgi:hypothetical protein